MTAKNHPALRPVMTTGNYTQLRKAMMQLHDDAETPEYAAGVHDAITLLDTMWQAAEIVSRANAGNVQYIEMIHRFEGPADADV